MSCVFVSIVIKIININTIIGICAEEQKEFISIPEQNSHSIVQLRFKADEDIQLQVKIIPVQGGERKDINSDGQLAFFERIENSYITANIILPDTGLYCLDFYGCRRLEQAGDKWKTVSLLNYFVHTNISTPTDVFIGYPVVEPITASKIDFKLLQWNAPYNVSH